MHKIVAQNKTLFAAVAGLTLFFSLVLFVGVKRIYDRESEWRRDQAESQLLAGRAAIQSFIANFEHHLNFLANLPEIQAYAESGFESPGQKKAVEQIGLGLIRVTPDIFSFVIVDTSGFERLRVANRREALPTIFHSAERGPHPGSSSLETRPSIKGIEAFIEVAGPAGPNYPILNFIKSLPGETRQNSGFVMLSVQMAGLLSLLSDGMFLQTSADMELSRSRQGDIMVNPAQHRLPDRQGELKISEIESIHYATTEPVAGMKFLVGLRHQHIGLKAALQRFVLVGSVVFGVFIGFVALISAVSLAGYREKLRTQKALISSLVELTDFRDQETGRHLERTGNYSQLLAERLRENPKLRAAITHELIDNIYEAAPLHDIGKVAVRDAVLRKKGPLTKNERDEMEAHVRVGGQVIDDIIRRTGTSDALIQVARNIVKHHHEKYNGKGYPLGLKEGKIPLEARIFALADVYDALRAERPYKKSLTHPEAVDLILAERGEHFDPDVVDAFIAVQEKFKDQSEAC